MSEELNPGAAVTPDVLENAEEVAVKTNEADEAEETAQMPNYVEMSLAELSQLFEQLADSEDRMAKSKEAEAIKTAFYKKLSREKSAAGLEMPEVPTAEEENAAEKETEESSEEAEQPSVISNPFAALENGFKAIYNRYKKERAEYNRKLEAEREENLKKKQAVIDDLKALVEKQDDLGTAFPAFRELQARWRAIGQVPVQNFRNLNDTYQFYVEQFYDKVQINRDLRDLDFKKNLEAKEEFCQEAEKLSESENVIDAFKELQKLHEQWKEFGPVAKEFREQIWDRFKAATAVINKKYQAYFEDQKAKQADNLAAKSALCEKVEAIADKEDIKSSNEWNALSKEIENIQKEWKTIGFAPQKMNVKIFERFRKACDEFFRKKGEFFKTLKEGMNENLEKKRALCEKAEALKDSTDWKVTADELTKLQKEWKTIGPVAKKYSDAVWKRFISACDYFFEQKNKATSSQRSVEQENLEKKKNIIEKLNAIDDQMDTEGATQLVRDLMKEWNGVGHVPFKEKDRIYKQYHSQIDKLFERFNISASNKKLSNFKSTISSIQEGSPQALYREREKLVRAFDNMKNELQTYENNLGFLTTSSKKGNSLLTEINRKVEKLKADIELVKEKIKVVDENIKNQG